MEKILLVIAVFFSISATYSQDKEIKHITGAKGRYLIVGSISEEEAKSKALAEAKLEALKMAGVAEHIQSYDMLFKSEIGSKFEEVFMSDIQSEIRGAVTNYTQTVRKGLDEAQNIYVEITIDAEVVLYKVGADPSFKVNISGIKQGYQNKQELTFTIVPSQNCYLNIFNLYERNASLMYPNQYEPQQLFEAGKKYKFPLSDMIEGYELVKTTKEPEKNKLVFVFTKENIKYVNFELKDGDQVTSFEDMSTWLFSISPDKRVHYFQSFVIY